MQNTAPLDWLLENDNPMVKYQALRNLLELPENNPDVKKTKETIQHTKQVEKIFSKMHPNGYWLYEDKKKGEILGKGTAYKSYTTTHFNLAFLSEMGIDHNHTLFHKAAERYFSLQNDDGDFYQHMSCLYAYNIRTFVKAGYRKHPNVQKAIDLMLNSIRYDKGYLCDFHAYKRKTLPTKSCIRGTAKVLHAFSEMPEYWDSKECKAVADYFNTRQVFYNSSGSKAIKIKDPKLTIFPFVWASGLLEILVSLAKMGYGNRAELDEAWQVLESKKLPNGRYKLDWAPPNCYFKPGKRGEENKWVTLFALMALKYRNPPTLSVIP